jgi:heme exporter protein D
MLAGGYSWRLYFYVEIAFAGALLILAFFVVEETMYDRKIHGLNNRTNRRKRKHF